MRTLITTTISLALLLAGCEEQVTNEQSIDFSSISIQELAIEITKDAVYWDLQKQTKEQFDKIKTVVNHQKSLSSFKTLSKKEVLNRLGLHEDYWRQKGAELMKKSDYLNSKFELNERSDDEVKQLFRQLYTNFISKSTLAKSSNCQAQFEADIASAHATYDFMIMYGCPIIALRTGFGGLLACSAAAVYNATLSVAKAIDKYNACMK